MPGSDNRRRFYDQQYLGDVYATGKYHGARVAWVDSLIKQYFQKSIRVLEVGCGLGHLQKINHGYIGVDISLEGGRHLEKPFVCGSTETLPFADQVFDMVMSFTVLEHLSEPELALVEMDRVLKNGGLLVLDAAWRVPPWRPLGLEVKPYQKLSLFAKIPKACLPILNALWTKGYLRMPLRILRELRFSLTRQFSPLPYTRMQPNWNEFLFA